MTMPHLMNCEHSGDGWCLDCVKALHTEKESLEEDATNYKTLRHVERVRNLLNDVILNLIKRQEEHDQSKMESPEVEEFMKYTKLLSGMTYGSPEFNETKLKMKSALDHHYSNNRHHPEHFKNGIDDMTLMDLIEMFCDWKASSERHNDGNIHKSIEINGKRFKMSKQLVEIFENTAKEMDWD